MCIGMSVWLCIGIITLIFLHYRGVGVVRIGRFQDGGGVFNVCMWYAVFEVEVEQGLVWEM